MDTRIIKVLFFSLMLGLITSSCYYDNEQDVYPFDASQNCDTLNITYTNTIKAVLDANCVSCHSASNPSGGVTLDSYQTVSVVAANGKLYGSISHQSGYTAMPQGGNMLSDCNLSKFSAWINDGYPQ